MYSNGALLNQKFVSLRVETHPKQSLTSGERVKFSQPKTLFTLHFFSLVCRQSKPYIEYLEFVQTSSVQR